MSKTYNETRVSSKVEATLPKKIKGHVSLFVATYPFNCTPKKSIEEIIIWFAKLDYKKKLQLKKVGCLVVSEIQVALSDTVRGTTTFVRGDIMQEMDAYKWNFNTQRWSKIEHRHVHS